MTPANVVPFRYVRHGVVTCAGHGLQWDKATGTLVRERRVSP